jgi:hypothetical protein
MMASLVEGEKPVARQTRTPASRQALKTSQAPGMAATWPARTAAS